MKTTMSVENNGWTWSSDHEDWYRAELLADGRCLGRSACRYLQGLREADKPRKLELHLF